MQGLLIWFGAAAICLQFAVVPILVVFCVSARSERSGPSNWRIVAVMAGVSGLFSLGLLAFNWFKVGLVLQNSQIATFLAILGFAAIAKLLYSITGSLLAPRFRNLPISEDANHRKLESVLYDAADAVVCHRIPRLAFIRTATSPCVTGIFRPVLLFPIQLLDLEEDRLRIILTHEMAHLKLNHLLWSQLVATLSRLTWPNPIGTAAIRSFEETAETEADTLVETLEYAPTQIQETRRAVRFVLGKQDMSLAFVAEESTKPLPIIRLSPGFVQVSVSLVLLLIGVVGSLLPLLPVSRPSLLGFANDNIGQNSIDFQFGTPRGDWIRTSYDVIYVQAGNLIRMRGDGQNKRVLVRRGDIIEAAISKDGTKIAYIILREGKFDLCISDGEGNSKQQLTQTPEREHHPYFSPDGTKIVYSIIKENDFGNAELMILDLNTGETINLSDKFGPGIEPSFGHDGTYILYMMNGKVLRANLNEDKAIQLTFENNSGGKFQTDDHSPICSPDGLRIAFTRIQGDLVNHYFKNQDNRSYTVSVWIMNSDGGFPRQVTKPESGVVEQSMCSFAPHGNWIAYTRTRTIEGAPQNMLYERDIFTNEERPLVPGEFMGNLMYTGYLR